MLEHWPQGLQIGLPNLMVSPVPKINIYLDFFQMIGVVYPTK